LYYPPGSLKQRLCVAGRDALYAYCAARGVPHARLGKLVVATSATQEPALDALAATALANGVTDLRRLSSLETARLEPAVRAHSALLSPSSGILDSLALIQALQADAEAAGATVSLRSRAVCGETTGAHGFRLLVAEDSHLAGSPATLQARTVVLCAGLGTPALLRSLRGVDATNLPRQRLAKGNYFALRACVAAPFARLVYPLPQDGGLGVHATLDLAGRVRFGPDVQWLPHDANPSSLDYRVDPARAAAFEAAVRQYWPALPDGALVADYSGIRPKLSGPGDAAADFVIAGSATHGARGLVALLGIESPGLTACLALADAAARAVQAEQDGSGSGFA
jgi:L-2-hydroxyglutarate oxidase LhgO